MRRYGRARRRRPPGARCSRPGPRPSSSAPTIAPVHLVLPADRRIDNARLRAILGTRRLRFVTPDELWTLTGCVPGAVPPFGHLFDLEVLVDQEITRAHEIAFNAGSPTVSITMRGADFIRLSGARICRFVQD
jgi:Ala-tRNA(Pro) deacylase